MTTIALTGGSGFVGRHVLATLLARGLSVRALVRNLEQISPAPGLTPIIGRLDQPAALADLVDGVDVVIHLAGSTGGLDYADFERVNVAGTRHLLDAVLGSDGNPRFIHLSSLAAREPALSDYASSKLAGEALIAHSRLNWVIVRPPAVYGPDDPALRPLWRALALGWLIRTGPPQARFSLLHVDDLASALITLAEQPHLAQQQSFELDDGYAGGYTWSGLAAIAEQRLSRPVRTIGIHPLVLKSLGHLNALISRLTRTRPPPLVPGKVRELVHHDWVCDNSKLPGCDDWQPKQKLAIALHELPGWRKTK